MTNETPPQTAPNSRSTIVAMRAAALSMAVFGVVPFANWIAGGHEFENYSQSLGEWSNGALIVAGFAVVLVILSRRLPIWRPGF